VQIDQRIVDLLLRLASSLSGLRRVPVLGGFLSGTSRQFVPPGTLIWAQIQQNPAQGVWIHVDPRTGQSFHKGIIEPAVQQAIQQHLRDGMNFYDVGANIGFFSLMAACMVSRSGSVLSFEADPEVASRLRENLIYNKFMEVLVEETAVWSEPTTVSFVRVDRNNSPDRGLGHVSTTNSSASNIISVEAISLDQFVLSHSAPDFLKCDVEGAEVAVFQGPEGLLREKHPILLVEMYSSEDHRVLTQKFSQLGYPCRNLDENHVLALP
jgi:FkbM family methyltransferase